MIKMEFFALLEEMLPWSDRKEERFRDREKAR